MTGDCETNTCLFSKYILQHRSLDTEPLSLLFAVALALSMPRGKSAISRMWESKPRGRRGRFGSPKVDVVTLPPPSACTRRAKGAVVLQVGGAGAGSARPPFTVPPRVLDHGHPFRVARDLLHDDALRATASGASHEPFCGRRNRLPSQPLSRAYWPRA